MKKCIACHTEKTLDEFYKHPAMKDGTLNKCKECCKKHAIANSRKKASDPDWVERERVRGREKYHRLNYGKRKPKAHHSGSAYSNQSRKAKQIGIFKDGDNVHHWNYNPEYDNDVFIMNRRLHKLVHAHMEYIPEKRIYSFEGQHLDTKEKHERAIKMVMIIENIQLEYNAVNL